MRWSILILVPLACGQAHGEDIASVLRRSQQQQIDTAELAPDASARADLVRAGFMRLLAHGGSMRPVELRVTRNGGTLAQTLRGNVVLASVALAELPEAERLFILAHELGHVALDHGSQMGSLYRKWVPGEVTREHTDAVAASLGRDASRLAHQHEHEADAFALRRVRGMGFSRDEVLAVFKRGGLRPDTATHPGTRRRVAALLAIDSIDAETVAAAH